jgi:hypothetical protein
MSLLNMQSDKVSSAVVNVCKYFLTLQTFELIRVLNLNVTVHVKTYNNIILVLRKEHLKIKDFFTTLFVVVKKKNDIESVVLGEIETMLRESEGGTVCMVCGKTMAYRHDARRHFRMQHLQPDSLLACQICGKVQKHHWALGDHMRKVRGQYAKKS